MTGHAFLAPSGAPRWGPGGCPASAGLEAQFPEDEESEEAREGTAAHFYLTETLAGRTVNVGDLAPNGFPIDATMIDAAGDYLDDVRGTLAAPHNQVPSVVFAIEERVFMHGLVHPQNDGTPDTFFVNLQTRTGFVWDYKYGHRYVDPFENWQCLDYLVGIMERVGIPPSGWGEWTFHVTIAQPRNYHPDGPLRLWTLSGTQLAHYAARLREAAGLATSPDPEYRTGEHCRDCKGRHACAALQRSAMALVDVAGRNPPVIMTPEAAGLELLIIRAAMKRLGARATGLEEQVMAFIAGRQSVPHWGMEHSKGRERWTLPVDEVIAMGDLLGVPLAKPTAITPNQARAAGLDPDLVRSISEIPSGGLALVPVTDNDIAKRFS